MPDVLIRNLPQQVVDALKKRAEEHRRSLQQELVTILEEAAEETPGLSPAEAAAAFKARLEKTGRVFSDSTRDIREDRDR